MNPRTPVTQSILLALTLLVSVPYCEQPASEPKNPFRIWVQPQLGVSGPGPGAGLEVNVAYRNLLVGARTQASTDLCIFCTEQSRNHQSALIGAIKSLSNGNSVSVLSGISKYSGNKRGKYEEDDGFMSWGDGYESVHYEGIDVPVEFGLIFGGKNFGFGLTIVLEISDENPSGGVFLGVPFGSLGG
jgi:hypothetical protein